MERLNCVFFVFIGLVFVSTSIEAVNYFQSLLGSTYRLREQSGSGQEDAMSPEMDPPIKMTKEEALTELRLQQCPNGAGISCYMSDECYTLEEACDGKPVCNIVDRCNEDPECIESFRGDACSDIDIVRFLTHHGVPNYPQLRDEYDIDAFLDLRQFENTEFCPDGRVKCNGGCVYYEELCSPETGICKCNGEEIRKIVDDKLLTQKFRDFVSSRNQLYPFLR